MSFVYVLVAAVGNMLAGFLPGADELYTAGFALVAFSLAVAHFV